MYQAVGRSVKLCMSESDSDLGSPELLLKSIIFMLLRDLLVLPALAGLYIWERAGVELGGLRWVHFGLNKMT